jgi:CubicO group peptidase (beta-lactamase class C family)
MERDAKWMIDDVGHEQGGCCLAMTLRDFGRFGQFILEGARIGGRSVVGDNWLTEATKTQVHADAGSGYGYQWWTSDDGTFNGYGIYGQMLHIDRTRRLVVVLNSAAPKPVDRAAGEARRAFIAAVERALDGER